MVGAESETHVRIHYGFFRNESSWARSPTDRRFFYFLYIRKNFFPDPTTTCPRVCVKDGRECVSSQKSLRSGQIRWKNSFLSASLWNWPRSHDQVCETPASVAKTPRANIVPLSVLWFANIWQKKLRCPSEWGHMPNLTTREIFATFSRSGEHGGTSSSYQGSAEPDWTLFVILLCIGVVRVSTADPPHRVPAQRLRVAAVEVRGLPATVCWRVCVSGHVLILGSTSTSRCCLSLEMAYF